ncbi:unnamed protein product [Medioppia subpectinata]|uniref:Uncharacterized protein n=1 Tax=Medioppia subpectinata TaxID=1979941 RepID=A0A7R9KK92_9ACAR|nr:unnamed protein product [Medioppia subpectinata]CAG2104870.1 unnamed protein product [Medioppia subpectinata]
MEIANSSLDTDKSHYISHDAEKIILMTYFTNELYTISLNYGNQSIGVTGHALTHEVKECTTRHKHFAQHCIQDVRQRWPRADHNMQRVPEFYFTEHDDQNFTYYYDFMGTASGTFPAIDTTSTTRQANHTGADQVKPTTLTGMLYEPQKCCIIYELLDCMHTEYKRQCPGLSFAPVDEVLHLSAMQVHDRCDGYHIDNPLYRAIDGSGERHHVNPRNNDKNCHIRFGGTSVDDGKKSAAFGLRTTTLLAVVL